MACVFGHYCRCLCVLCKGVRVQVCACTGVWVYLISPCVFSVEHSMFTRATARPALQCDLFSACMGLVEPAVCWRRSWGHYKYAVDCFMNARVYVERSVADRAPSSMMARHVLHCTFLFPAWQGRACAAATCSRRSAKSRHGTIATAGFERRHLGAELLLLAPQRRPEPLTHAQDGAAW